MRLLAAVSLSLALSFAAFASPPVFSKTSYADAIKTNATDGKLLIIKGTAVWCGPCKQMDKTTWVDEKVVQFVKDNGVAIAVDVDDQPDVAKTLSIEAMPTMIIFKDGKELDRTVGFQSADKLLGWFDNVKAGKTNAAIMREKAGKRVGPDGKVNIQERLEVARGLTQARDFDKALEEYVWLWNNMLEHEFAYVGVRGSFMASEMEELAKRHEPAMKTFTDMRDTLAASLKEKTSFQKFDDWVVLNQVVGDTAATLAWFDRVKNDPAAKTWVDRSWFRFEQLLEAEGRWADMGSRLNVKQFLAMQKMERNTLNAMPPRGDAQQQAMMREVHNNRFRESFAKTHMALLAADREADAQELADELLKELDDTESRVSLVTMVVDSGYAKPWHTTFLDDADTNSPDTTNERIELRRRLERALAATKK
jgi:thioredoxin 1